MSFYSTDPDWASLNLGILICIECSGIHRNLGTHVSKVRSVGLDEWTPGHLSVMQTIGNELANSIWEALVPDNVDKPAPMSSNESKEAWIRSKYEAKAFLAPLPASTSTLGHQLIEAVSRKDIRQIIQLLAHASSPEDVNATVSTKDLRTPVHVACSIGSLAITQMLILVSNVARDLFVKTERESL